MEYLFTQKNLSVLESFCLVQTLLAFDYDGTLAPIVTVPAAARMRLETQLLLKHLCLTRSVAVISGRRVSDVQGFIPEAPVHIIGNHGGEDPEFDPGIDDFGHQIGILCRAIEEKLRTVAHLGIVLENKTFSLSLHYRTAADPKAAHAYLDDLLQRLPDGFRVIPGKYVFNVVKAEAPDKYSALLRLMDQTSAKFSLFFGDDETDEDVFRVRNPRVLTVRVGFNETSKAKYFINDQLEMDRVLKFLLR